MKKATLAFTVLIVAMIFSVSVSLNLKNVRASDDYAINHVDHKISLMYNSYVLMNDTIMLSGQMPDSFLLGFPYSYGSYVLRCIASDVNNRSKTFPVTLNEPMENQSGFYGLKIDFSGEAPQNFNVQVVFSNRLVAQDSTNTSLFSVAFPAFPSLTKTAEICNSSITLPTDAVFLAGTVSSLSFGEKNLAAFTYNMSNVLFNIPEEEILLFDVDQLNREIRTDEYGEITGLDSYYVTNRGTKAISQVDVFLPTSAVNVSAEDQFGRNMAQPVLTVPNTSRYTITFTEATNPSKSTRFDVTYHLPSGVYLKQANGTNSFTLDLTLFQEIDYYINEAQVTFVLPEGAKLQTFEETLTSGSYGIGNNVFQQTVTMNRQGMSSLDNFDVVLAYEYNPLWIAFRPTIWVLTIAAIGCVIVAVIRRTKAPTAITVPATGLAVRAEYIRSFVEAYEEKMKILSEIDSLESKAQKGRIPRRQYKVQTRTLETRLETLTRNLADFKERMRSAGGHYASLMRELEVAETEMNEVNTNVKSIEARHSRGEISLETYRRLLGDYQRRKEKTETNIDGILLRLREEIR